MEESQEGFYKSQKEVDRAFALRLAAERKKWERERLAAEPSASGAENLELNRNEAPTGEEMEPDAGEMDLMEQKRFLMSVVEAEGRFSERILTLTWNRRSGETPCLL